MRPLRALLIYLAFVFFGGALLAPWLLRIVQIAAGHFAFLQTTAAQPFHRYVDRSLLALALAGLWPLLREFGVRKFSDAGLVRLSGQWRRFTNGFAIGFASLAFVAVLAVLLKARAWNGSLSGAVVAGKVFSAAATAIVVAVLEELLFRGGLFGGLRRVFDWRFALVVSSAVYALVHFLARADFSGEVTWSSGLALLPQMLRGLFDVRQLLPGFLNLTLAGAILALAFQRTGNLWFSIGLHAGWIFWLKIFDVLTVAAGGSWLFGTGKLINGVAVFFVLLPMLLLVGKILPPPSKPKFP